MNKKYKFIICLLAFVLLFATACQNRKIEVNWDEWLYNVDVFLLNGFPSFQPMIVGGQEYARETVLSWLREENFVRSSVSTSDIRSYDKLYSFMHFYPFMPEKEFREGDRLVLYATQDKLFARIDGSKIIYESINPHAQDYEAFEVDNFGDTSSFLPPINIPKDIDGNNLRIYESGDLLSGEDASNIVQEIQSSRWDMLSAGTSLDAAYSYIDNCEAAYILCGLQKDDGILFYAHYMDHYLMLKYDDTIFIYRKK